MSVHALKAIRVEDVPANQTSYALATFEWTRADRAHVVASFIVDGRREVLVVGVWPSITEIGQSVELNVALRSS